MKKEKLKFIKRSSLFLLIFFIILFILNTSYIHFIEKRKLVIRKEAEWQKFKSELPNNTLEYAFFGDSHARHSFNPRYLNNSFNFGTGGEDYIETYFKILKLLSKDKITIKNMVIEIDIHSFSAAMHYDKHLFRELYYYAKFVPITKIAELRNDSILSVFIRAKLPVIQKGAEIIRILAGGGEKMPLYRGWVNFSGNFSTKNKEKIARDKFLHHFSDNPKLFQNKSVDYFLKILKLAKEKNISIIFIKYPLTREYDRELKEHNISRKKYYEHLFNIINKTGINYKVLDYYSLFFDKDGYFDDADHLNYIGAANLSVRIREDLNALS